MPDTIPEPQSAPLQVTPSVYTAGQDGLQCGIPLLPVQVSCPSNAPSQLFWVFFVVVGFVFLLLLFLVAYSVACFLGWLGFGFVLVVVSFLVGFGGFFCLSCVAPQQQSMRPRKSLDKHNLATTKTPGCYQHYSHTKPKHSNVPATKKKLTPSQPKPGQIFGSRTPSHLPLGCFGDNSGKYC